MIGRGVELQAGELGGRQHWPFVTGVPSASVTVPTVGRPVTVIVSALPSISVGAGEAERRVDRLLGHGDRELEATGAPFTGVALMVVPAFTVTVPSDTE